VHVLFLFVVRLLGGVFVRGVVVCEFLVELLVWGFLSFLLSVWVGMSWACWLEWLTVLVFFGCIGFDLGGWSGGCLVFFVLWGVFWCLLGVDGV